jgi:glycosyltransferase involved in cell wall biosynthesis
MHELAHSFLHFDPPLPGLIGGSLLQGWLVAKPGHHFTDVRVVAGSEIFPGIHGIPRQDLAAFFKSEQPYLLAGFSVTLTLPAGRHRLQLEACTIAGSWEAIDSVERDVTEAEAQPDPEARTPLDATALGEMLRILLRRMSDSSLSPQAGATALVRASPARHHLQHPPRPFHGHIDQPQTLFRTLFGRLPVTGWVFHESLPIKRVFATTDLLAVQNLKHGRATDFLPARFPQFPLAQHGGYDGFLDLPAQLPLPVTVRVYAELADGSWHLGSVARFTTTDQEFAKQPFVTFSPLTFWRAWRALVRAIKVRGWPVPSGPAYRQTILDAWREYSALAPRPHALRSPQASAHPVQPRSGPRRIHLITHNLSREGAPLFLLEFARHLQAAHGVQLAVTSGQEGPLRQDFEKLGACVQVVDPAAVLAARGASALRQALQALGRRIDLGQADLVVANTTSSYWGVSLAVGAQRPVLLEIHESTPPRRFFHPQMDAGALSVVEASLRQATRVNFLTATTRRYYADLSDGANYVINPGWIDLAAIDRFRSANARENLRAQLAVPAGRKLVVNVGTVCERKGQHVFARAVELLWRTAPEIAATADFLMIGGRDTPYDRALHDFLQTLNRPNLRIVNETGAVYPYYGAADLFVCSSYEESFPRVVLEAMAFTLPLVCSAVHGIPEIARADREALLVPPGDTAALASAMQRLLADPTMGQHLAQAARIRVADFDSKALLPRHAALALSLTAGNS